MRKWILLLLLIAPALSSCAIMTGDDRSLSREGKAMVRIARKLMFKKVRSELKDQLEDEFRADPSMTYDEFQRRANTIHNIGKRRYSDYEADKLRQEVLENADDKVGSKRADILAEEEVDLIRWGPFIVDDEGSIKFNPLVLFKKEKVSDFWVHAADTKSSKELLERSPLYREDNYKVNVKFRVSFNPLGATRGINSVFKKYRLLISTDHFTDYTHRKKFTREYEFSYNAERSEASFFFNFIIPF